MSTQALFSFFQQTINRVPYADQIVIFAGTYLGWILLAGLLFYFFRAHSKTRAFWQLVVILFSAGLAWFLASLIKYNFQAARPFEQLTNIKSLIAVSHGDAFPSAHTAFYSALALAVWFYNRRWGWIYLLLAIVIGLARVVAGVHWPVDIAIGLGIGLAAAWLTHRVLVYLTRTL